MNLATFLDHWKILENPFKGEEARQDPVFLRLEAATQAGVAGNAPAAAIPAQLTPGQVSHSEFEKIAGDFAKPTSAIVFGEKGSGKTAIRLQLADRIALFNKANPTARCLWIGYDDLNPVLGRFVDRGGGARVDKKATVTDVLARLRLADHIDGILTVVVPALVDAVLKDRTGPTPAPVPIELAEEPRKIIKRMDKPTRRDFLVLQAVYDRPELSSGAEDRTQRLRRVLKQSLRPSFFIWTLLALFGWIGPAYATWWAWRHDYLQLDPQNRMLWIIAAALAAYLLVIIKRSGYDRLKFIALGHRVRKQVRVSLRSDASFGRSIRQLPANLADSAALPMGGGGGGGTGPSTPGLGMAGGGGGDDVRYAMLERLKRVLRQFGYASLVIVLDRIDEPTLIAGDPDRMRAVIWPLLNNKFLQQPSVGVKMLLPMELRHALFRESSQFFEQARLDKQNMVERLSWTGVMLYDICNARLQACRTESAPAVGLIDLFAEDVTRQDLIDALDQMHQPRDAFKMLYQCLVDHCAAVTGDQPQWRIPRLILDHAKKHQVERVRQLAKGVRPA